MLILRLIIKLFIQELSTKTGPGTAWFNSDHSGFFAHFGSSGVIASFRAYFFGPGGVIAVIPGVEKTINTPSQPKIII